MKAQRQAFQGSCHCGFVKFVIYLTFPHRPQAATSDAAPVDRIYRCNCRICHKSGYMHVRPPSPADDFALLLPVDPFVSLGDYQCHDKLLHFFFCRTCGVRCFTFMGEGHVVEAQPGEFGRGGEAAVKVWRPIGPQAGSNINSTVCYLSVNGHTVDAGQNGFDMRELVENKSVMYYDYLNDDKAAPAQNEKPHPNGSY